MLSVNARWWVLLFAIVVLVAAALVYGQPIGFIISGKLSATPQEEQEGYFHVGEEFMVITKPKSPIHGDLSKMVGREVTVVVESR